MKTFIYSLALSLIFSSALLSQTPTWHVLPNSPQETLWRYDDLSFINENTGWVLHNQYMSPGNPGKVYKTTDGGNSWVLQFSVTNIYLRCIGFADSLNGWIGTLGNLEGLSPTPILYRTTNSGLTWDSVTISNQRPWGLCGMNVLDRNNIFACGRTEGPAYFIKTTDGGLNWISQNLSAYASDVVDCKFFTPDSGFVVGSIDTPITTNAKCLILFTSDGGTSWVERFHDNRISYGLWKISFPDRYNGFASINGHLSNDTLYIVKTTNSGLNWNRIGYPVTPNSTQAIGFLNANTGWTCGFNSPYKTTDGGLSWQLDNFGTVLNRIRFLNDTIGYAAGLKIYKFTSEPIGIKPISTEIPKQFSLEQNYPNPFNPVTKIKFLLPAPLNPPKGGKPSQNVRLIIYDVLGREITTIVNEQLKPGTYEISWDASNYPSGDYFYGLQTESFTESKKMILIK